MDMLAQIAFVAFVVEGLVEWFVGSWSDAAGLSPVVMRLVAAVVGVILCAGFGLDLFKQVGIVSSVPYLGAVVTGLVISRGSNALHDLYGKVGK